MKRVEEAPGDEVADRPDAQNPRFQSSVKKPMQSSVRQMSMTLSSSRSVMSPRK